MELPYRPNPKTAAMTRQLSKAIATSLKEQGGTPNDNMEAVILCAAVMADVAKLKKTADELYGMAGAIDQIRELSNNGKK